MPEGHRKETGLRFALHQINLTKSATNLLIVEGLIYSKIGKSRNSTLISYIDLNNLTVITDFIRDL